MLVLTYAQEREEEERELAAGNLFGAAKPKPKREDGVVAVTRNVVTRRK